MLGVVILQMSCCTMCVYAMSLTVPGCSRLMLQVVACYWSLRCCVVASCMKKNNSQQIIRQKEHEKKGYRGRREKREKALEKA